MDKIVWSISEADIEGLSDLDFSLMVEELNETLRKFEANK